MKTLRKYTNMALLLVSVATIVPAYANPVINEQENVKQKDTFVESQKASLEAWYNRPVREKIYEVLAIGGWIVAISVAAYLMAKREQQLNNPEYQWKVHGHVMTGWEVIDGNLIKKVAKICPGCCV